jgi:DNA-binding LacI/PurR family transcriptional regulator
VLAAESAATAVFAHGRHLPGLYAALRRRGESIPGDRSVLTFTDSRLTPGLADPTPSAIHIDTVEVGRRAIGILDAWLAGEVPPNVSKLDLAEWQETASVAAAPAP